MRPSGPRVRPNDPRQQRQPVSSSASSSASRHPPARGGPPADRDQVFASIFGRPAGGHHTAATNSAHSSPAPQGYAYSPNLPPAHAYPQDPQQQFMASNYDPYAQSGRQPIPNAGYEAFAPPLPPPPPPTGNPGQIPTSLGGPRDRPMMRAGTDFDREQMHNAYRYEVGSIFRQALRITDFNLYLQPEYPRARRTSTTPSVDGSSTFSSRSSLGAYPAGAPAGFTSITSPASALPYDRDPVSSTQSRNVSGASSSTAYATADPYNRPQRDSSLSATAKLAHNNSITSNRSYANSTSGSAFSRYDPAPGNYQSSAMESPGSMYDSIFENVLANSSTTSLPHVQGQSPKPLVTQTSSDRNDADSPPPEYSTYAPHDVSASSTARPYGTEPTMRSGIPALPEIVRDAEGLRLFDDSAELDELVPRSYLSQRSGGSVAMRMSPSRSSGHHSYEDEMRGTLTVAMLD